ncbi:hypothetical protein JYG30_19675 [Fibrella sp. USSR17]
MSYRISMFHKEVADRCEREGIPVGQIQEEEPESLKEFSPSEIEIIKDWLNRQYFTVEHTDSVTTEFKHKSFGIQATLREGSLDFSGGAHDEWEMLMVTSGLMLELSYSIIRYNFQLGEWG